MIARWILAFAFAAAIAAGQERLDVRIAGPVVAVTAGNGAVIQQSIRESDGIHITVEAPARELARLDKLHVLWKDLIAAADPETARRLSNDAAMYPGSPRLYVQTREDGTRGFAVTLEQLKRERKIVVPSLGVSLNAGEPAATPTRGRRVLDEVRSQPEATYRDFTSRWEDMGNPDYKNPGQTGPGHTICLARDSSMRKFGIDRWGSVRNDLGTVEPFEFRFDFDGAWKSQSLLDGLPIVTTVFERKGVRFELEQFAGPPSTDRAWFELYRNMLIQERDDGSLLLAGFTPRPWLKTGERIEVARAPSRFGRLSFRVESRASSGEIEANIEMPDRTPPSSLFVRLRHPSGARIRSVKVNGRKWTKFNAKKEWVEISGPLEKTYRIVADFPRP